jgi:hypothetical protein
MPSTTAPAPGIHEIVPAALRPYAGLALAMFALFAIWAAIMGEPDFPLDDAYITLHNAGVLLRGSDPNYGVSALVGATSSVHLLLVAAAGLFVPLPWAGALITWLAAGLYLAGLLFVAQRHNLTLTESVQLMIAGALSGFLSCHLLNGIETGLAMALVVWSVALAMEPRGPLLPVLLGLMPFVRPELAVLAAALGLDRAWMRWQTGEHRALLQDAAIVLLVAIPWPIWMYAETGAILPQTVNAKRYFFAEEGQDLSTKLSFVLMCMTKVIVQTGPLVIGAIGLIRSRAGQVAILSVIAILVLYAVYFPIGVSHNEYRYLYALVPLFAVGFTIALHQASERRRRWLVRGLIACAAWAIVLSFHMIDVYARGIAITRNELVGISRWIDENLPPDARIALHDAGYVAYANDRAFTDIVGLKTPAAMAAHAAITKPSHGTRRVEALSKILRESRSNYLVVLTSWDNVGHITRGLSQQGWKVATLRDGVYRVVRLTPPPAPDIATVP